MRWRFFEVAVALLALLASNQLAWLAWKNISDRVSVSSRYIWVLPSDRNPANDKYVLQKARTRLSDTLQPTLTVTDRFFSFTVFAPPQEKPEVWFNGESLSVWWYSATGTDRHFVELRRGENQIEARTRVRYRKDSTIVVFRPPNLLPPNLLGIIPEDDSHVTVVGYAEPDSGVFLSDLAGHGLPFNASTSYSTGIFQFSKVPNDVWSAGLRATVVRPDLGNPSLTALLMGEHVEMASVQLNREVRIKVTRSHITTHYLLKASVTDALRNWVEEVRLSPQQAISSLFGACVAPSRAAEVRIPELGAGVNRGCEALSSESAMKKPIIEGLASALDLTNTGLDVSMEGELPIDGLGLIIDPKSAVGTPILASQKDAIELEAGGEIDVDTVENPSEVKAGVTTWRGRSVLQVPVRLADLRAKTAGATSQIAPVSKADQTSESLEESGSEQPQDISLEKLSYNIPNEIRGLLRALLSATPFVWLLWILRRGSGRLSGYRRALAASTGTFLVFHFTILSLPLFYFGFRFSTLVAQVSALPRNWQSLLESVAQLFPFWSLGIIFILGPTFVAFARSKPRPTTGRRILFQLERWLVFWPLVLVLPPIMFLKVGSMAPPGPVQESLSGTNLERWSQILPSGALTTAGEMATVAVVACSFFLYWAYRVLNRPLRVRAVLGASCASLFLPILPALLESIVDQVRSQVVTTWRYYPTWLPQKPSNLAWIVIIVWAGVALLMRFGNLAVRRLDYPPSLAWFRRGLRRFALLVIFVVASVPLAYFWPNTEHLQARPLQELGLTVDALLPYALLVGLLVLVRKANQQDSFEIPSEAASVCVLVFSFYLAGRTTNFFFIPIPLILGWWVFSRWVLVAKPDLRPRLPYDEMKDQIARLVRHGERMGLVRSRRKALEKKYSEGGLSLTDYNQGFAETEQLEKETQSLLPEGRETARRMVFEWGSGAGPWANARTAALYGLILSLPFEILALRGLETTEVDFPLLQGALELLFPISTWVLSAFVFGYFYHRIRGRDGFEKALAFSAALIVPTLPMRMIAGEQVFSAGHMWEIFEVVAFMLVLALLAFDLRLLYEVKNTWRELLGVYGVTWIAAYGGSIVVAVGLAMQQQVVSFLVGLFKH